jgi:hypothetical protein
MPARVNFRQRLVRLAYLAHRPLHVRFTPKSGHRSARWQCPLCANSGHSS